MMKFKKRTLRQIAEMICGDFPEEESFFEYRTSYYLTEFFRDCGTDYTHNGTTRRFWVAAILEKILAEPQPNANIPPETFSRVIRTLMDQENAFKEGAERKGALEKLNAALVREGFVAFYANDKPMLPAPHRDQRRRDAVSQPAPPGFQSISLS